MKKITLFLLMFISLFTFSSEEIVKYDMKVLINKDLSIDVNEVIRYKTDEYGKRGIYRIIPYKYSNGSYFKMEDRIKISNFDVNYTNIDSEVGLYSYFEDNIMINRLGKRNIFLNPNEEYEYNISYKIYNIFRFKDNIAQIYFNALGNYWEIPINEFNLEIKGEKGNIEIFTGLEGENTKEYDLKETENGYKIKLNRKLLPNEGLSFIINYDNLNYSKLDILNNKIKTYPILFLLILTFIVFSIINFFILLTKYKRRNKKSIIIEYIIPDVKPIIAKKLIGNTYDYKYFLIVFFQLIEKEIIKFREKNPKHEDVQEYVIKYGEKKPILKKSYDDYIEKQYYIDYEVLNKIYDDLSKEEKIMLSKLELVKNDIFKKDNILVEIDMKIRNYVSKEVAKNYMKNDYLYFLTVFIILLFTLVHIFLNSYNIVSEVISMIIIFLIYVITIINSLTLFKYTKKYYVDIVKILGFKKFLTKVDSKKLKNFKNIDDIVKYFKDILPYAIAFNLENEYLKLLDNTIKEYSLNREYIYDNIYYYHIINRHLFYNNIKNAYTQNSIKSNSFGGKSSFSGSFTSSGSTGGGFGGGGGRSW